jgi:hypothetical protein
MNAQKIEGYLVALSLVFREMDEGVWLIDDPDKGLENVVILAQESLVTIRVKVMDAPIGKRQELFEQLLRLNAELVHCAYALENDSIILVDTLELASLAPDEFQASLDEVGLTLAQHYPVLSAYRDTPGGSSGPV